MEESNCPWIDAEDTSDALPALVLTPCPLQTLTKFLKPLHMYSFLFPKKLLQHLPISQHSNAAGRHFPILPNKLQSPEPGVPISLKFLMLNKIPPEPQTLYPPRSRHSQGPPSTLQASQGL